MEFFFFFGETFERGFECGFFIFTFYTCLTLQFKFYKQVRLRIFWALKLKILNKKKPLNNSIKNYSHNSSSNGGHLEEKAQTKFFRGPILNS